MDQSKQPTDKPESEKETKPPTTASPPTPHPDLLPDLPNYDPAPADGVRVGESPVPGLTLKRILRGHTDAITRIAWSPDGRLLASPSDDKTIRIWDVAHGKCTAVLKGHKGPVRSVAWSPDGQHLASSSIDETIRVWNAKHNKPEQSPIKFLERVHDIDYLPSGERLICTTVMMDERTGREVKRSIWSWNYQERPRAISEPKTTVQDFAVSPNGKLIASAGYHNDIKRLDILSSANGELLTLVGESGQWSNSYDVAWAPDGDIIATGSQESVVYLWNPHSGDRTHSLEGHTTNRVNSVSFNYNGQILASSADDGEIRFWRCDSWETVAVLSRQSNEEHYYLGRSLAFNPCINVIAILHEARESILIWTLNWDVLLGQTATDSVRYTTAKLVLVGDSGVGKTGLGWRLAHGEFKEHSSTHGQQFWLIDDLCTTRGDGTECEAVLWDLAGQHVYRQIHSIFLDNVDASLVLFDPSNRQDPLKGAQFWLEQLKGKGQLPPSVLVGARVDRGAPALSQDYLAQFCQRYGISGGYVSTSAKSGEGLEALVTLLKDQISWDEMTTTVTTVTFKRIKDYVLALKEKPDRKGVLVSPRELREQLQAAWQAGERPFDAPSTGSGQAAQGDAAQADWQFTDAEMMTAVGHLQTHGYVTILNSSSGETHILLTPDLLVDLASSIVLLADKHERELGAVNETALLQGRYPLDELEGLDEAERHILLDAAVLRFLEHNVCFREILDNDNLLIFPGLIKQKRPLADDFPATDDVSYVVRGRVENLYAMLVVVLGYTPSFVRINQWQNQAQYEMGKGEICGFRLIEDREGEIELVLYYSKQMPQNGRESFQELFERFLYQREVEVTRFPPVVCPQGHQMERATVIRLIREGKISAFCAECGGKIDLPELDKPSIGIAPSGWLQREEAAARLRSMYETHLTRVKGYRRGWATPRCYLSRAPGQDDCAANLIHDLQDAGVYIIEEAAQVQPDDYVVVLDTPAYQKAWEKAPKAFAEDVKLVRARMAAKKRRLISIKLEGRAGSAAPHDLRGCTPGDFCDPSHYPVSLFNLVLNLYAIPFTHAGFAPLRESLHQQWEQMPRETKAIEADTAPADTSVASPSASTDIVVPPSPEQELYVDFDHHISPEGHVTASSCEGEASADIPVEIPNTVGLSRNLIAMGQINADLVKQVGQALYDWLFPTPIHTHLHQTEAVARTKGAKLRLRMRVEAEEIASLPLEFMYRKSGDYFLAVNPDTALSRYLSVSLPQETVRRRQGPLHMLAIISSPNDDHLTPLNPDEWETLIREALAEPLSQAKMTLKTVKHATRKEIRDALLEQKPDIIQFVGHGSYRRGRGYLALVDEDTDETWWVNDEQFANLYLGHADHLGLISLASCESGKSDDPQGFVGIAPKLVQRGVPAVLSMQYKVPITTAKIFLEDFYTAVAARKPIDWATQSARNAIALELGLDNREFATPVLYMRAKDGEVF